MPRRFPKFLRRKTTGYVIFDVFNLLFLILFSLSILYPFWTTFLLSFSKIDEVTSLGFHLWIKNWSLSAYKFAFSKYGNIGTAYANSIFRTVVGTVLTVIFTLLAAYPLSKKDIPGRNGLTPYILITMFLTGG
jgi:putative aldouronate transport system permease protein